MRREKKEYFFDYSLLFIVLFLLIFGLVMLYSTSSYMAAQTFNDSAYWLKKQIFPTILGLVGMFFVALIPYHFWERFATLGYAVSVFLILLIIPFGVKVNGAKRWLKIFGISLQPAEVAKLCIILFMATFVCKMGSAIKTWKGLIIAMIPSGVLFLMIWKITSNLSSAIIVISIAAVMLFVASPEYGKFIFVVLIGLIGVAGVIAYFMHAANNPVVEVGDFRGERFLAWLDLEKYASGKGFQTLQALYAIGSGGIWGKGLGQSMQKLGFLPEAQNDMIFSIICEELGLFGAVVIISLFLMLIWRFMVVANNAPDMFGALLVVGVMAHIAVQVILNIAVVTNTIPNTGISLPFISYGGSSVMFLLVEIGLVLNVARRIQLKEL